MKLKKEEIIQKVDNIWCNTCFENMEIGNLKICGLRIRYIVCAKELKVDDKSKSNELISDPSIKRVYVTCVA